MSAQERAWTVLASRTLLENPWFAVTSRDVRLPDGTEIDFQSVEFRRPSVGIVARRDGRILLIHQYRVTIDRNVWGIPSGGVDAGEAVVDAARRELEEETGLQATSMRPLVAYNPSYGATNQLFETFLAEDPVETGRQFDENEVMAMRWFDEAEVRRMLLDNGIVDGLSVTPLAMLFLEDELKRSDPAVRLGGVLPDQAD